MECLTVNFVVSMKRNREAKFLKWWIFGRGNVGEIMIFKCLWNQSPEVGCIAWTLQECFLSGSGCWRMTFWNFNCRAKVSSGCQLSSAKMFLKWWILLDKSSATNDCLDLAFVRSTRSFTSLPPETRLTVYRQSLVSDLCKTFCVAEWNFSKLTNSFVTSVFFIHTYVYCAFACEGFIEFGGQDNENERGEVS